MWPGWTRSYGVDAGSTATWIVGAVVRRDAGRDALARLDRDGEGGAERRLVLVGHLAQPELVAALLRQAQADEPAGVRDHEVDGLGSRELGRDREVALVLAVFVVDDDHEAAGADLLDRLLDAGERGLVTARRPSPTPPPHATRQQFLDVLREHVRLEVDAAARNELGERRLRQRVRISATSKPASSTAATVSETPSTVIDPFLDAVAEQLRRGLDPGADAVSSGSTVATRPTPSTWPWTLWPPSGSPARSAGLDVDAGAERLHARDRLGDDVEGEGAVRRLDHGQADAVDRDRVPRLGRRRRLDHEPPPNDATFPPRARAP